MSTLESVEAAVWETGDEKGGLVRDTRPEILISGPSNRLVAGLGSSGGGRGRMGKDRKLCTIPYVNFLKPQTIVYLRSSALLPRYLERPKDEKYEN